MIFGEDVELYDMWRPHYQDRVFDEICSYANLSEDSAIMEIGCGTGQATESMLKRGHKIRAVEASKSMCEYANDKFGKYFFSVENALFEEAVIVDSTVDLFFAATSFHWIDEEIGYTKMRRALKENGCIALIWNRPFVARKSDLLHSEIQGIYRKYIEQNERNSRINHVEDDWERYKRIGDTIKQYGFRDVEFHTFKSGRTFNSKDYVCLLNTYSDHITMEDNAKKQFENEIMNAIDSFGGVLKVYDTVELYLARK